MDPFVAEIRIFAGNFAPKGWALCDGQILSLSQNTALFSLLGTTYGGDGMSNFALPNLQGSTPLGAGQGPGLSLYDLGEQSGSDTVTLLTTELPAHTHPVFGRTGLGDQPSPVNAVSAQAGRTTALYGTTANTNMSPFATSIVGGSLPHNNMPPFLGLTFIIALQGVYPPRS